MNDFDTATNPRRASVAELVFRAIGCLVMLALGAIWFLLGVVLGGYGRSAIFVLFSLPGIASVCAGLIFAKAKNKNRLIFGGVLAAVSSGLTVYVIWAFFNAFH
jgi:hypothetical protein